VISARRLSLNEKKRSKNKKKGPFAAATVGKTWNYSGAYVSKGVMSIVEGEARRWSMMMREAKSN
jgi:hypothetical protein